VSDDLVKVAEAGSEMEASLIVGFLKSHGIGAAYDGGGTAFSPARFYGNPFTGNQEILVRARDAERAARLLAERQG
jgi:hypothetical protein